MKASEALRRLGGDLGSIREAEEMEAELRTLRAEHISDEGTRCANCHDPQHAFLVSENERLRHDAEGYVMAAGEVERLREDRDKAMLAVVKAEAENERLRAVVEAARSEGKQLWKAAFDFVGSWDANEPEEVTEEYAVALRTLLAALDGKEKA